MDEKTKKLVFGEFLKLRDKKVPVMVHLPNGIIKDNSCIMLDKIPEVVLKQFYEREIVFDMMRNGHFYVYIKDDSRPIEDNIPVHTVINSIRDCMHPYASDTMNSIRIIIKNDTGFDLYYTDIHNTDQAYKDLSGNYKDCDRFVRNIVPTASFTYGMSIGYIIIVTDEFERFPDNSREPTDVERKIYMSNEILHKILVSIRCIVPKYEETNEICFYVNGLFIIAIEDDNEIDENGYTVVSVDNTNDIHVYKPESTIQYRFIVCDSNRVSYDIHYVFTNQFSDIIVNKCTVFDI